MSLKENPISWQGGNHETHETCVDDRRNPCEQRRLTFGAFHSLVIVLGAITITVSPAVALVITPIFDSTWGSAPIAATTAVQDVITEFETWFDNPITTTINFSWGNSTVNPNNASLGITDFPNQSNGQCCGNFGPQYNFSQTTTLLTNASMAQPNNGILSNAIMHFPSSYPNPGGSANFYIGDAEFLALTGTSQNSDPIHAFVGFQSGQNYDFTNHKPKGNETDFHAVAEHEISHAMGRVEYALSGTPQGLLQGGGPPPFLTPLDFYKYNVVTHALDPNRNQTQFSIDGTGLHLPTEKNAFNSPTIRFFDTGSDSSDWIGNIGVVEKDSFNRFITTGVGASVTPIDLVKMEALGWDPRTPCYMECINRWTELPLSLASSLTAVIGGNVVDEIDLAATQSNPAINPFAYVNQNFFGAPVHRSSKHSWTAVVTPKSPIAVQTRF